MRIVVDATSLLNRSAGVKSYMHYWIRSLQQHPFGHRIDLFPYLGRLPGLNHEESSFGRWKTLWGKLSVNFCNIRGNRVLELLTRCADVFHASVHLVNPPTAGTHLTATIHDMTCWIHPETHTAANIEATRRYGHRVLRRAAACIAISESSRRDAIEILGLAEDRVRTIYPGVDDSFFLVSPEDATAVKTTYGLGKPYMLFVGMIEPRKNIDRLLDAYSALPLAVREEYDLVLAGPLGWCSPNTIERLLHPGPGIHFLGYVPERNLPLLTAGAAMFLFPSLYEGFGLPVAQAMACGVPVVTSRGSSLEEIGGDAVVLIDPCSVEELAAAVARLALSACRRKELGELGRRRANGFRWDRCARESIEFFERIAH
jgi:glycosyltransferase involved in cell wall biosynthesis